MERCPHCDMPLSPLPVGGWSVVDHPSLVGGWYAIKRTDGRYYVNPKSKLSPHIQGIAEPYGSRGAAQGVITRLKLNGEKT